MDMEKWDRAERLMAALMVAIAIAAAVAVWNRTEIDKVFYRWEETSQR